MTNSKVLSAITKSQRVRLNYETLKNHIQKEFEAYQTLDEVFLRSGWCSEQFSKLYRGFDKVDLELKNQHLIIRNYLRFVTDEQIRADANEELRTNFEIDTTLLNALRDASRR